MERLRELRGPDTRETGPGEHPGVRALPGRPLEGRPDVRRPGRVPGPAGRRAGCRDHVAGGDGLRDTDGRAGAPADRAVRAPTGRRQAEEGCRPAPSRWRWPPTRRCSRSTARSSRPAAAASSCSSPRNGEGRLELGEALARHADVSGMVATGLSIGICLAERYRPELVFLDLGRRQRAGVRGLPRAVQPHQPRPAPLPGGGRDVDA